MRGFPWVNNSGRAPDGGYAFLVYVHAPPLCKHCSLQSILKELMPAVFKAAQCTRLTAKRHWKHSAQQRTLAEAAVRKKQPRAHRNRLASIRTSPLLPVRFCHTLPVYFSQPSFFRHCTTEGHYAANSVHILKETTQSIHYFLSEPTFQQRRNLGDKSILSVHYKLCTSMNFFTSSISFV